MATCMGEVHGFGHQANCFVYTWVLKDFNQIVSDHGTPGVEIRSECLEPNDDSVAKICLSLYPGGRNDKKAEYVSVCLRCLESRRKAVFEQHTVTMKSSSGRAIRSHGTDYGILLEGCSRGVPGFIPRRELLEEIPDNVLVAYLEFSYSLSIVQVHSGAVKDALERSPVLTASEDFLSAMKSGKHSDVRIVVQETEIPAHRFVLAARSKVFSAMFDHDRLENGIRTIEITDFDAATVGSMLNFMYSGTVRNLDPPLALELLRAAYKYDISGMKTFCGNFLVSHMNEDNAIQLLIFADVHADEELLKGGIDYIKSHSLDFGKCESMLVGHPKLFIKLLTEMHKK